MDRGEAKDRFFEPSVRSEFSDDADHFSLRGDLKRCPNRFAARSENAVIDGVMWKGSAARLAFAPQDGVEVIATGKLTTYPGRSKYQIVIETMEIAGEGALLALLEKLKARLGAEGLFDPARKQLLPFLPKTDAPYFESG